MEKTKPTTEPEAVPSEDQLADDIADILLSDAEETGEPGQEEKSPDSDGSGSDGADSSEDDQRSDDEEKKPPEGDTESKEGNDQADRAVEQPPELAADGLPIAGTDRTNNRIKQLVDRAKAAEAATADAQRRAEELERLNSTSTSDHPDPQAELDKLRDEYARIATPQQVLQAGTVNPLTGEPYTAAEAQAAIADYKQDLQFKMSEAERSVVDRMQQAREAEKQAASLQDSLVPLLTAHPELDPNSVNADPDLCDILQGMIDANAIMERGLLTGWKTQPQDIVAKFDRFLKSQQNIRVNTIAKTDKKAVNLSDRKQSTAPNGIAPEKSGEDEFLAAFDDAMKEMGF